MPASEIHQCECDLCRSGQESSTQRLHCQINLLMSRLDEQQRRWYAAVEALRMGHGGIRKMSQITGLDEQTIRRGKQELQQDLVGRPEDRVRLAGAGRPQTEKKSLK